VGTPVLPGMPIGRWGGEGRLCGCKLATAAGWRLTWTHVGQTPLLSRPEPRRMRCGSQTWIVVQVLTVYAFWFYNAFTVHAFWFSGEKTLISVFNTFRTILFVESGFLGLSQD
jgi:hypothetical protein